MESSVLWEWKSNLRQRPSFVTVGLINEENYAENLNINLGIFQLMIGEVLSQ